LSLLSLRLHHPNRRVSAGKAKDGFVPLCRRPARSVSGAGQPEDERNVTYLPFIAS
jgi:hypothetical protein